MLSAPRRADITRRSLAAAWLLGTATAALLLPVIAHAQFTGKASATGQFESNSNVFALEDGATAPANGGFRRGDTYFAYGAEMDGHYEFSRQQLFATASTKQYDYQHFGELDHNDYKLDTGLIWKLGDALDGQAEVIRTHTMVPLLDLSGAVLGLTLATDQRETLQAGLKFASDWKVEASGFTSRTIEPIPQAPDLDLKQNSGTLSLEYLGVTGLTSGVMANYLSGEYGGSTGALNPAYSQKTAGFVASYILSRTTFDGQVGYTSRVSSTGIDNASGVSASLDLKERLTPKTSFTFKIDREINNYLPQLGSEIDSEAAFGVNWQATYKLSVLLDYSFTYRAYPLTPPIRVSRVDYQQLADVGVAYQPLRWLVIKPYANLQVRESNFLIGRFNATIFGVSFTASTPDRAR